MIRTIATILLILVAVVGGPCVILLSALDRPSWTFLLGLALVVLPLLLARAINRPRPEEPEDVIEAGPSVPLVPHAPGEAPPDRD